jgi:hypothetical protein
MMLLANAQLRNKARALSTRDRLGAPGRLAMTASMDLALVLSGCVLSTSRAQHWMQCML